MPSIAGIGTVILIVLSRLGMPVTDWALVGRWVGLMRKGRFTHTAIGHAPQVRGERALGWMTHYAVGIAYAGALLALAGTSWASQPTLLPAPLFGLATVVVPLFVMQPAMGSGIAGRKTPSPLGTGLRSATNHAAFGGGLYLAAVAMSWV